MVTGFPGYLVVAKGVGFEVRGSGVGKGFGKLSRVRGRGKSGVDCGRLRGFVSGGSWG